MLSLEEATPKVATNQNNYEASIVSLFIKPTEQDAEIPQEKAFMNFVDIDSALGQALKDLGDF